MCKIFEGKMNISIIHLDLQTSLLIHRHDTTLRFQSWPTLFTLALKMYYTVQNYN
jgi:hypothetical protein